MLKSVAVIVTLTSLIFLTACGGGTASREESKPGLNTTNNASSSMENSNKPETNETKAVNFKSEILLDFNAYQDQLTESDLPALQVLEKNLTALVEHDHVLYQSGFVNEKLAEAMDNYYSEDFQYRFTDIESIESNLPNENQVNITVIGQRLDEKAGTVEDVKMLYAIRPNDQGDWVIYTID